MSSRRHTLLENPLPPLRVCVELGFLLRSSDGVYGAWVMDLTLTQDTCALAFLVKRVLASRAMYDSRQIF